LTPRPSQLAPRGNGDPAAWARCTLLEISNPFARDQMIYGTHY